MFADRKLLELAALASGIVLYWDYHQGIEICSKRGGGDWNPLTDDGDALRLAVTCCLPLDIEDEQTYGSRALGIVEPHGSDSCAATRRAIVRAAAEIGKGIRSSDEER